MIKFMLFKKLLCIKKEEFKTFIYLKLNNYNLFFSLCDFLLFLIKFDSLLNSFE